MNTITIKDVEALADQLEADDAAQRAKLERLIRAYARIVAARDPDKFEAQPLEYADEDGHWDNSYPPKLEYKEHNGPALIEVLSESTADLATSSGFYYEWRRVTEDPGLYVSRKGVLYGATHSGTGHFGQFAAHPGDHHVEVEIEYLPLCLDEVSLGDLRAAEEHMRKLAFPAQRAA